MPFKGRICSLGVWDESVPGIEFDNMGVSNYAKLFQTLADYYPRGEKGRKIWDEKVSLMQKKKKSKYDCVIGVSGGVDSSYLLHLAKKVYGLNPLAVNLDNGWSSDIAVKNIKKVTKKLDIDLFTYVIDYSEVKDLLRVFMLGGLPWIDAPTDLAIRSILEKVASQEKVSFILRGNDFRSEGTQPFEWTGGDSKVLKYLHRKYGAVKLRTYPNYTLFNLVYYGLVKEIKSITPFYHLDYLKQDAKKLLISEYNWEDYGGHHFENIFTKFAMSYWLPVKFGIDKRKITLSAQVLSGAISRENAIDEINKPPFDNLLIEKQIEYVCKKLDFTKEEFENIIKSENKYFSDYPSYTVIMNKYRKLSSWLLLKILQKKPMTMFQKEMRTSKK